VIGAFGKATTDAAASVIDGPHVYAALIQKAHGATNVRAIIVSTQAVK